MTSVYLSGIKMKRESKSYVDSVHAIMKAAGLFKGPKYMLSGLSGMAFKFSVHKQLLPLSVSAYGQWGTEHSPAIDNLGVLTISDGGRTRLPMFRQTQLEAVSGIKESLDRGVGAVYWIPEFGVIHGYDDDDQVFYAQDGWSGNELIILYDNLGLNFTPFWYCEVFGGAVEGDRQAMVLESLRLAIYDWDTPYKTLPDTDIASGRLAYRNLIDGLLKGDYDEAGAAYILESFAYSRHEISLYLVEAAGTPGLHELAEAAERFVELNQVIGGFAGCWHDQAGSKRLTRSRIGEVTDRLKEAEKLENQAVDCFRAVSAGFLDLKRSHMPRWGSHMPR